MSTKHCEILSVAPHFACNVIPVVSPPILSFLFYFLLHALVNKQRVDVENISHPKGILYRIRESARLWEDWQLRVNLYPETEFWAGHEPCLLQLLWKGCFCTIFVLGIVKLVMTRVATSAGSCAAHASSFSLTLFFHQSGLWSICTQSTFKILECCGFAYKAHKGKEIPDCMYKHQNSIICKI